MDEDTHFKLLTNVLGGLVHNVIHAYMIYWNEMLPEQQRRLLELMHEHYDIRRIDLETKVLGRAGEGREKFDQAIIAKAKKCIRGLKTKCGIRFRKKCGKDRAYVMKNPPSNVNVVAWIKVLDLF